MRRILLVGGFLLLGLVFVCVVVAGGPYTRWVQPGAVVYTDPDSAADVSVTVTKTVAVSVTLTTGWAEITSPPELAGFVQTSQLLKEEPSALKVQRRLRLHRSWPALCRRASCSRKSHQP